MRWVRPSIGDIGLIVRAKSGIHFEVAVGGQWHFRKSVEGIFVPLYSGYSNIYDRIQERLNKKYPTGLFEELDLSDLKFIDKVLRDQSGKKPVPSTFFLSVDFKRAKDAMGGWVPVQIAPGLKDNSADTYNANQFLGLNPLIGFGHCKGILVWPC